MSTLFPRLGRLAITAALFSIAMLQVASADDEAILAAIDQNFESQITFLEETVNQNSGTLNIEGVEAVGQMFTREFDAIGFDTRWIKQPDELERGGHFVATKTFGRGPHLLLIGHLDTVFEKNSPFQSYSREGDTATGPGIGDMKGGNAVILYALKALLETDAPKAGKVTVFLTGDEESPGRPLSISRRDLIKAGKAADIGGTIVESGDTPNHLAAYGKTNVVAQKSIAAGGLRFMNDAQLQAARAAMRGIVEDNLPGTEAKITFTDSYPAMEVTEANKALLDKLNAVHARLGLAPAKAFPPERRGAADISFVAPYVTSMDGLGVDGEGAHGLGETMSIESMRDSTRRAALLISDLLSQ